MTWTKKQILLHEKASFLLTKIIHDGFSFLKKNQNVSEYETQQFLYTQLKKYGLIKKDSHPLIIAFGLDSAIPHYEPKKVGSRKLHIGNVVKIDIWARLKDSDAPYADITWMGIAGNKITSKQENVFREVIHARNAGLRYLRKELKRGYIPTGKELHEATYASLLNVGYKYRKELKHSTGHCLGFTSPHGRGTNITSRDTTHLKKNVGYTIEPGIYLDGKFGVRSEINFYINSSKKLCITTPIQKDWVVI